MPSNLTWKEAIIKVLEKSSRPLSCPEITEQMISNSLRKSSGATPSATVNAQITSSIKHHGENSPFIKIDKGIFDLRDKHKNIEGNDIVNIETEEEEQYDVISSFGMYWSKNAIEWSQNPQLLGMQQIDSKPVDFNKQIGIYLLYDGREVIYVGRTTDRPLGRRLYEHTIDRLSSRWNRFSWFGLLPVSSDGSLEMLPEQLRFTKLIPALEAILIEALEPRQNRKRGDDLASVEYMQKIDPQIEKKKIRDMLDTALNKL